MEFDLWCSVCSVGSFWPIWLQGFCWLAGCPGPWTFQQDQDPGTSSIKSEHLSGAWKSFLIQACCDYIAKLLEVGGSNFIEMLMLGVPIL